MSTTYEMAGPVRETGASFPRDLEQAVERTHAPAWARMGREMASRIALLTPYLEPCYRMSERASFPSVSAAVQTCGESGRRIHEGLTTASGWFYRWRDLLARVPERPKKDEMVRLVEDLDRVLTFTGLLGTELAEVVATPAVEAPDRTRFGLVAHRYDRFLRDYERVWRRPEVRSREPWEWPTLPAEPYYARIGIFATGQRH